MLVENLNLALLHLLNASSSANESTIKLAILVADYAIYLVPVFLVITWLFGGDEKKNVALKSVVVALIALGIAQVIVRIYPHPRPFMLGVGRTLIAHAPDPSFPSDHMTFMSSIALTYLVARRYVIGWTLFAAALCVAWSRVYLGVHFPLDMVGGAMLALLVVLAIGPIWNRAGRLLTHLAVSIYEWIFAMPIKHGWVK